MKFSIFQDSRVGARSYNQDRLGYWYTRDSLLLVLADGMGGHLMGEVAAQIAVDTLGASFQKDAKTRIPDPDLFLYRAVGRIHAAIDEHTQRLDLPDSPRTTLVACVVQDGHVWWTHVGDSRLYLIRRSRVVARTRDHTRVQQLVDQGRIREEAISSHPERNLLLQCLGGGRGPRVEPTASARLMKDDIVLLCSDGFWGPLTQRQLLGTLAEKPIGVAVPELMTLAETRAGAQGKKKVVTAEGLDFVFLATTPLEFKGEGIEFSGQAGAVRVPKSGEPQLLLLRGSRLSFKGKTAESPAPAEPQVTAEAGTVRFVAPAAEYVKLTHGNVGVRGMGPFDLTFTSEGITGTVDGDVRTLVTTWPEKIVRPGYWMDGVRWCAGFADEHSIVKGTKTPQFGIAFGVSAGKHDVKVAEWEWPAVPPAPPRQSLR